MEKLRFSVIRKKCLCCGRSYPSSSKRTNCTCKDQGRLFAVGTYYQPKIGGGVGSV
jgi:hypothetical protein